MPVACTVKELSYGYRQPLSSMVFGTNALITKPAQSIAPMLTVAVLNRYGYSSLHDVTGAASASGPATVAAVAAAAAASLDELKAAMVSVCCVTSLLLGVLQLCVWSMYRIRESHHSTIVKHVEG